MQRLSDDEVRDRFLRWQCRIRQDAMRRLGGRPMPAMRPRVLDGDGNELLAAMTILVVPAEPANDTAQFRFQVQREAEARRIYDGAMKLLQGAYFQQPGRFSDTMTALFPNGSATASNLARTGRCLLVFAQHNQSWKMSCGVRHLEAGDALREHTLWHNRLFNPQLSNDVEVLAFQPVWQSANADPALPGQ